MSSAYLASVQDLWIMLWILVHETEISHLQQIYTIMIAACLELL